jgi:hypothetical protein
MHHPEVLRETAREMLVVATFRATTHPRLARKLVDAAAAWLRIAAQLEPPRWPSPITSARSGCRRTAPTASISPARDEPWGCEECGAPMPEPKTWTDCPL